MTARAAAGAIAFGFIATVVIGAGGAGAGAAAPDDQGWWTTANGGVAPAPAPPDVPSDGLLVQGGPGGSAVAYAALRYALPSGTAARILTLSVAPNSATTPLATLEVCPLRQPEFQPAQGGAMTAAPAYTCATKVTGAPGANGKDYHFDLTGLNASGMVAIAVLPTAPTDRVVLSKPTGESLSTGQLAPAAGPQASDSAVASPPPLADAAPPTGAAAPVPSSPSTPSDSALATEPPSAPSAPSSSPVIPDAGTPSVPPTSVPAAGGRSGALTQLAASPSPGATDASPAVAALAVAAAVGGASLWAYAGRREVSQP